MKQLLIAGFLLAAATAAHAQGQPQVDPNDALILLNNEKMAAESAALNAMKDLRAATAAKQAAEKERDELKNKYEPKEGMK